MPSTFGMYSFVAIALSSSSLSRAAAAAVPGAQLAAQCFSTARKSRPFLRPAFSFSNPRSCSTGIDAERRSRATSSGAGSTTFLSVETPRVCGCRHRRFSSVADNDKASIFDSFSNNSVSYALFHSVQLFKNNSIPEPEWSAVHLLSTALDLSWDDGYRHLLSVLEDKIQNQGDRRASNGDVANLSKRLLSPDESAAYASMVNRRFKHEPLQYIIGKWDFCDLTLKCRAPCLCPRPETEELVDCAALEIERLIAIAGRRRKIVRVLDVGCGTGAIGLALAKKFGEKIEVTAVDIDETAVNLSNENAKDLLGSDVHMYRALLCSASDFTNSNGNGYDFGYDLVVANPPYISRADMATLSADVVDYESDNALCGGDDGLDVVRDIIERLPEWSADSGCVCWMEVDTSHPVLLEQLLGGDSAGCSNVTNTWSDANTAKKSDLTKKVQFVAKVKDLYSRDRFVKLILS